MNALTTTEQQTLEAYERIIEANLEVFLEIGSTLARIEKGQLYRGKYASMSEYLQKRWGMSANYAGKHIRAAKVVAELPQDGLLPANEAQARPLTTLDDPAERAEAWQEAVQKADGEQPTAAQVSEAVKARKPRKEKAFDYVAFFREKFEEIDSALADSDTAGCRAVMEFSTYTNELAERYAEQQEGE